ncbi:DUF1648 domain-containing protein [Streptomyces sp. ME19-01-6]|uniref:DUF1648 domain-containing protein n=1 Tax=Streptomyces sp. ME19-01-6 TaxID=3028686 RepID=UPI0029A342AE|nr:DUF1648 domain-containing protein [Streptomyces sp. ME19-01-6]MDX3230126.1 DUF1648 domain-containing protein [Streptomyces sp. ME19-01-6]
MHHPLRRTLVVALPFVLACAAVLTTYAALHDRLPDPLATHFPASGKADGFTSASSFLWVAIAVLAVQGAVFAVIAHRSGRGLGSLRLMVALGYGESALLGYLFSATLFANANANADVPDAADVRLPMWQLAVALACALPAAAVGRLLAGADAPPAAGPADQPQRLPLGKGEVASWTRTVTSRVLLATGPALAGAGAALAFTESPGSGLPMAVMGVIVVSLSGCRVTVDRRGLTVSPPVVRLPRLRVPLGRIEEATSRQVSAYGDFGGWGYRIRAGRRGLVLRSGDALCLRLSTGKEFVVTVDDARTAAALLNTLIERAARGAGRPADAS